MGNFLLPRPNACNTHEVHRRLLETTIENVRAGQRGRSLNRVV